MRQPLLIRRGHYDLLLPLGEGRLTRVYLAVADGSHRPVVVKRLRPELARDPQLCADFLAAAHIGMHLRHPQIATTLEVFTEGEEQLFAMEYLEGQTLADLLRRVGRARMPLEEHLWVLSQALAGLDHCYSLVDDHGHPRGGRHREVSPYNIFITYAGEVKLMDFGLAGTPEAPVGARHGSHLDIGPFAPEQLCDMPVDERSDVFAMGILLWEALARQPRAVGEDRAALIAARVAGSEPGLEALAPGLPRALIDICARATELDPAGRFATVAELRGALEYFRAGLARAVGAPELKSLIGRNFQLDRDALRLRINQHLEDARSHVRIKTPSTVTPLPPHSSDGDVTAPGIVPKGWFVDTLEGSHEDLPATPREGLLWRRAGLGLVALAAAAVLLVYAAVRRTHQTTVSVVDRGEAHAGPSWEPTPAPVAPAPLALGPSVALAARAPEAALPVALDRAQLPRAAGRAAQPDRSVAGAGPTLAPTGRVVAPVMHVTASARARRRSASLALPPPAEISRRAPVPLLDARGGLMSLPHPPLQPPRLAPSEEIGRPATSPARRQLDEQDPYR
jgi:serine/threonine protein kinase